MSVVLSESLISIPHFFLVLFGVSGRWDIEMISGVLIKLPITRIKESLNLSIDLLEDKEFSNTKILDIRQKNQIVTND